MKKLILIILLFLPVSMLLAQDDLLKELEQTQKKDIDYTFQTFKGARLVNGHTVETNAKGTLTFIFAHRFGPVSGGLYELYGLDQAYTRLGLDYGITDRLTLGIGRSSNAPADNKTFDSYLKFKALRQSTGARNFPVTVTAFGQVAYKISPKTGVETVDRMAYVGQLLISRKFSPNVSFQIMPTIVHKNAADKVIEKNDQFAIGIGGRIKVTRSVALTSEYYYNASKISGSPYYDAIGFGIDIETGGHVFQLVMTNAASTYSSLTERGFITETTDNFFDRGVHFGFNVTRTFQLKKKK